MQHVSLLPVKDVEPTLFSMHTDQVSSPVSVSGRPAPSAARRGRSVYVETYGCQMNFSDTEIVLAILGQHGYQPVMQVEQAELILLNTCSIRENAEQKIRHRLQELNSLKRKRPEVLIGILGCMAERLKGRLLEEEKIVDLVVGPDAYRQLPALVVRAEGGQKAVNVLLSREETYADISPVRLSSNGVSAFVSIMRGCNNMCTFCVVPFTRGRERSRPPHTIIREVEELVEAGYREVTLLGQNVDSYLWHNGTSVNFAQLLRMVASVDRRLRVRFSTSHPKDMTDDVLFAMADHANICRCIHLPVQSGSTAVLKRMNRTYDSDWYRRKVDRIREILPDCAISTDIMVGFCGETEQDHQQTLDMMDYVRFSQAFMFKYSERPGTYAARHYPDDVPESVKSERLQEIINLQTRHQKALYEKHIGSVHEVLVEGPSRRSAEQYAGRNTYNQMVVFDRRNVAKGQYVPVRINRCTAATLLGEVCL